MPEVVDDDGQESGSGGAGRGRARRLEADVRDAEADAREAEADRREFQIDARELVLDRWEREIAARAAALGLSEEIHDQRREQRHLERMADGQTRRDQADTRRSAAIERDIRRVERSHRNQGPPAPVAGLHLPDSFRQVVAALSSDAPLVVVLGLVLAAALDSVDDGAAATMALAAKGRIEVAATTASWAAHLDEYQVALGGGPMLDAIADEKPVLTDDLGSGDRWPALADLGDARNRAAMSFGLPVVHQETGALTVYSGPGGRFGPEALATGEFLAALAAIALARSFERLTHEAQAQAWQSALSSRDAIGQAKGMLMAQRSVSADEAFDLLREASQRLNLKVRDIAVHLVEHREMPR